jgi:Zn-dependent protease
MKESVRLGRIAGVAVGFNWSLLVIAVFLALGLAGGRLPAEAPGYPKVLYALAGVLTAAAFLAAVLAHELSHAIVARHEGLEVDGIVLWLLGGFTRINGESPTPGAELRISGVGPLVSLLIGVAFGAVAIASSWLSLGRLWGATVGWLAVINIALAVFNILPGAPLDGGRVLHSWLWRRSGNRFAATKTVSRAGRVLGALMIALAAVEFTTGKGPAGENALWLAAVGWFLMAAARSEETAAQIHHALAGVRVGDLMAAWPMIGPGWLTVQAFWEDYASRSSQPAWPLQQWDGGRAGLVPVAALQAVPAADTWTVRAVDLAIPMDRLATGRPDEEVGQLLARMSEARTAWALVYDGEQLVGVIGANAINDAVRRGRSPVTMPA